MQKGMKKSSWIFLFSLMLLVSVAATTVAVMDRMDMYYLDDTGAMPINVGTIMQKADLESVIKFPEKIENTALSPVPTQEIPEADTTLNTQTTPDELKNAGFEVSSDDLVWGNETEIEIFKVAYENESGEITVKSESGDAVIAPGTENSTVFKLKNTGNVPLDYYVNLNLAISTSNEEFKIPIEIRLSRYDGTWIVGNAEKYVNVYQVMSSGDAGVLGPGKYIYYTLDWKWPFEGEGDTAIADMLDTALGNLKAEEELVVIVELESYATEAAPGSDGGIMIPETGDINDMNLWICLGSGALVLLLILIVWVKKSEKESQVEAEK